MAEGLVEGLHLFGFVLKTWDGGIVLVSELYTTKAAAQNGIASVQSNSPQDERYERKTASNGKFYFTLKAANHQVIGTSEMYATEDLREQGITAVKANGSVNMVKDLTA